MFTSSKRPGQWYDPQSPENVAFASSLVEKRFAAAQSARARAVYTFKREFLLAVAARDGSAMLASAAKQSADEVADALFPPVTEENAGEYLNRAW